MTKGRCLCGAVRYEFDATPQLVMYCHCESCRRATSSPVAVLVLMWRDAVQFSGTAPAEFESSPGVVRSFCGTCGSPIGYRAERRPEILHLYAGTLEDPSGLSVSLHIHAGERLDWFEIDDTLPRYRGMPKDGEAERRKPPGGEDAG